MDKYNAEILWSGMDQLIAFSIAQDLKEVFEINGKLADRLPNGPNVLLDLK